VQVTRFEPAHTPFWQLSLCVHALPSLQTVPLTAFGFEHEPVVGSQMPATWHWSEAVQVTRLVPTHAPPKQVSTCVHALPSLQAVPSSAVGFEHKPLAGSQMPAAWHWSIATQMRGLPPLHVPDIQTSVWVHALPSLQAVPSAAAGLEQTPVVGSQIPAVWHASLAVHVTGLAPAQTPATHVSVCVHAFPSLQVVPSACVGFEHFPVLGAQTPTAWH
jgi:hypothetical protein